MPARLNPPEAWTAELESIRDRFLASRVPLCHVLVEFLPGAYDIESWRDHPDGDGLHRFGLPPEPHWNLRGLEILADCREDDGVGNDMIWHRHVYFGEADAMRGFLPIAAEAALHLNSASPALAAELGLQELAQEFVIPRLPRSRGEPSLANNWMRAVHRVAWRSPSVVKLHSSFNPAREFWRGLNRYTRPLTSLEHVWPYSRVDFLWSQLPGDIFRCSALAIDVMLARVAERASDEVDVPPPASPTANGSIELNSPQRCLLEAAVELRAFDLESAVPIGKIAAKASRSKPGSRNVRNALIVLKHRGFLKTKPGPGGGHWITPAGRAAIGP